MNVLVSTSARLALTGDGELWSSYLDYGFWSRFLEVFDSVHLLARCRIVSERPPQWIRASGPGIKIVPLPHFVGLYEFFRNLGTCRQIIRSALAAAQSVHLLLPCPIGTLVWRCLQHGRPYAANVCGDPYDALGPKALGHTLSPLLRRVGARDLRAQCRKASTVAYVSGVLRRRYPASESAFVVDVANVRLSDEAFIQDPRPRQPDQVAFNLLSVGTLSQPYKGHDILIKAIALCAQKGLNIELLVLGEGAYQKTLESLAGSLGVGSRVRFGHVVGVDRVRSYMDKADLFVLGSRAEGLPKAMLEAMARGLPCVGTNVGGIPELLESDSLVPPEDAVALAQRICEILANPERMATMGKRNLEKAKEYKEEILRSKRLEFYRELRRASESWQSHGSRR